MCVKKQLSTIDASSFQYGIVRYFSMNKTRLRDRKPGIQREFGQTNLDAYGSRSPSCIIGGEQDWAKSATTRTVSLTKIHLASLSTNTERTEQRAVLTIYTFTLQAQKKHKINAATIRKVVGVDRGIRR